MYLKILHFLNRKNVKLKCGIFFQLGYLYISPSYSMNKLESNGTCDQTKHNIHRSPKKKVTQSFQLFSVAAFPRALTSVLSKHGATPGAVCTAPASQSCSWSRVVSFSNEGIKRTQHSISKWLRSDSGLS